MLKQMLVRTRVKICGITNVTDAQHAAKAGADSIGLVFFAKSKRNVSIVNATEIIKSLPAFVTSTALFVNPTIDLVKEVISATKVDLLQFHGEEAEDFCNQFSRPYIKAIRIKETTDLVEVTNKYKSAKAILFDTFVSGVAGGTGQSFNWQFLNKKAQETIKITPPIILAGGLNDKNVAEAISITQPWAVDVSGGVELEAGIKSLAKIKKFIKEVEK